MARSSVVSPLSSAQRGARRAQHYRERQCVVHLPHRRSRLLEARTAQPAFRLRVSLQTEKVHSYTQLSFFGRSYDLSILRCFRRRASRHSMKPVSSFRARNRISPASRSGWIWCGHATPFRKRVPLSGAAISRNVSMCSPIRNRRGPGSRVLLRQYLKLGGKLILPQTVFFQFTGAPESVDISTTLALEPWGRIGSGTPRVGRVRAAADAGHCGLSGLSLSPPWTSHCLLAGAPWPPKVERFPPFPINNIHWPLQTGCIRWPERPNDGSNQTVAQPQSS